MEAIIGSPFTFQVQFVSDVNIPVAVTDPRITIFMFSGLAGIKQTLVDNQPLVPVVPPEVGRYVYTWVFPIYLNDGATVYAEMSGQDTGTGLLYLIEQDVTAVSSNRVNQGYEGLIPRFIRDS